MHSADFIVVIAAVPYRPTPSGRAAAPQLVQGGWHQRAVIFYGWGWELEEKGSFSSLGEGLFELARAFFCARARVLLVSYWPVCSGAAVALTIGTLEALGRELGVGRAEALRRTMVDLIEHGPDPCSSYWASFVAVDE